jgi:hypothetical protein
MGGHLSIDADGMVRGSFSASVFAIAALKQSGIITPNDARAALGWRPRRGSARRCQDRRAYAPTSGADVVRSAGADRPARRLARPGGDLRRAITHG